MLNRCYGVVMSLALLGGLVAQVYVPAADLPVYFAECAVLTVAVLADAIYRRAGIHRIFTYTLFSLLLAPLAVPRWFANRPLIPGEWRQGGSDANFFNAFGLITVSFTGVSAACNFLAHGPDCGFELIINAGFAIAGTAFVMGLAARQERVMERGAKPLPKNVESEID